jgi:6-phosphogluconolactonase
MRLCSTAVVVVSLVQSGFADTFVYVSMASEQKIQGCRLGTRDGVLTPLEAVSVAGQPGSLAVDPRKKLLVASLRSTSSLASFRLDPASGKLKLIGTAQLPKGENAAFVATDRTGRWLLSASYNGGKAVVHRLTDDGRIQTPAVHTAAVAKTAHSVITDRDNRWVFVPAVQPNAVFQFRLDAETGKLTEAGKAAGGKENAGPRHIAFHPTLEVAYTADEKGSSVTAYSFNGKAGLKPAQNLSSLPADFKGLNVPADVKVHPNGKFLWITNRGHDSLAGFAIDGRGRLTTLGHTPTEKNPRSFDIDPDGRFLLAAGEDSGGLTVYRVDSKTGKLSKANTYKVGKSVTWVLVVNVSNR